MKKAIWLFLFYCPVVFAGGKSSSVETRLVEDAPPAVVVAKPVNNNCRQVEYSQPFIVLERRYGGLFGVAGSSAASVAVAVAGNSAAAAASSSAISGGGMLLGTSLPGEYHTHKTLTLVCN